MQNRRGHLPGDLQQNVEDWPFGDMCVVTHVAELERDVGLAPGVWSPPPKNLGGAFGACFQAALRMAAQLAVEDHESAGGDDESGGVQKTKRRGDGDELQGCLRRIVALAATN